uniref:ADAM10 endopeptidase n=1 Tax=Saccoglossus kowalevskii TaxID=10224 RepID=A0ABM0MHC4_SACKO|nr:PREDICTED: disintegrin and metalloproteinase domain-containing protein 10-like [Saccoglossus kowalevskii]
MLFRTSNHSFVCDISLYTVLLLFCSVVKSQDNNRIQPYIKYYEPVNYKNIHTPSNLARHKRDTARDSVIKVQFTAFSREFKLLLSANSGIFSPGATLSIIGKGSNKTQIISSKQLGVYKGILEDEPTTSVVHGHLQAGVFNGVIKTQEEHFHVEPAKQHFNQSQAFQSIIFKGSDVHWNDTDHEHGCGLRGEIEKKLNKIQTSAWQNSDSNNMHQWPRNKNIKLSVYKQSQLKELLKNATQNKLFKRIRNETNSVSRQHEKSKENNIHNNHSTGQNIYSRDANIHDDSDTSKSSRRKRSMPSTVVTCPLYLVADHTFYKHVGDNNAATTLAEMAYYIQEVDNVYRSTDFNGDGVGDNIGFSIAGVTVFEDIYDPNYKFTENNIPAAEYLNKFSEYNFNRYCMAILFSYRDFGGGVLGLAWIGYSTWLGPPGGVCQYRVTLMSDGKQRSMNTAMVTLYNYGTRVPRKVTTISVMHELGHSFGSPHDPKNRVCSPGGEYGNYLMYSKSTDGSKANNYVFSQCSKAYMTPVITTKGSRCFQFYNGPQCGNRIVEEGEECDCGTSAECIYTDSCCTPLGGAGTDLECTLRRELGVNCSVFTGIDADCPVHSFRPNGTTCNDHGRCFDGECTLTACYDLGLEDCLCVDDYTTFCHLCCLVNDTCVSSKYLGLTSTNGSSLLKPAGNTCGNYTGYCNEYGVCVMVDSDSALSRLRGLFSSQTINSVTLWLKNYWYYAFAALVGLCVIGTAVKFSYPRSESPRTLAYSTGIMAGIIGEAEERLEIISIRLQENAAQEVQEEVKEELDKEKKVEAVIAMSRLSMFFPTANQEVLSQTIKMSASEEDAVKSLLIRGYPMKRRDVPK